MLNDFLLLMKAELALAFILFLLLILKVGKEITNERLLALIQLLLLGNFIQNYIKKYQRKLELRSIVF
jgi:hypothetical protein